MIVKNNSDFEIVAIVIDEIGENATIYLQCRHEKRVILPDGTIQTVWLSERLLDEIGQPQNERQHYRNTPENTKLHQWPWETDC